MSRKATRQVERTGFALRLHTALVEEGLTAENFARDIDTTLRTVQRWRNGESQPSGADLVVIARRLGRDPAWFFGHEREAA